MSVIREPQGVDFVVAGEKMPREEVLETSDWLNEYRRNTQQTDDLKRAFEIIRSSNERSLD